MTQRHRLKNINTEYIAEGEVDTEDIEYEVEAQTGDTGVGGDSLVNYPCAYRTKRFQTTSLLSLSWNVVVDRMFKNDIWQYDIKQNYN